MFEDLFDHNSWGDSWRNGMYDYVHYHSRIHEVLGVARGHGKVRFGGLKGRTLPVKAGDVAILAMGRYLHFGEWNDERGTKGAPMAARSLPLPLWDRKAGKLVDEFMDDAASTYESEPQRSLNQWLESHPLYDWILAAYQNSRLSKRKIAPFIRKHHIDMNEFEPVSYRSYADFFERRFRRGARRFPDEPAAMGAFAEARYLAWDRVDATQEFPVKGQSLDATKLLGNASDAWDITGGPFILARLSPMDYHHVHYFDHGRTVDHRRLGGRLWTVNWHALLNKPEILAENERQVNILETEHFGRIGFVEIGALSVGRIMQVHPLDKPFQRGEEKSVFRFGGSAIAVFGQAGRWRPSADVLENTAKGTETMLRLGEEVARRP